MMKIVADVSKCIGAGQCVLFASELFAQGEDDGLVMVLNPEPTEEQREEAERAVIACPSLAIWLEDESGRRLV